MHNVFCAMRDIHLPIEDFPNLVRPLIGLTVSRVWQGFGSTICLELGMLSTDETKHGRHVYGEANIFIEWDWRVERGTRALFGSSDSGPTIKKRIAELEGAVVTDVAVYGTVPELSVTLSTGHVLRTMVMTYGEPRWRISLPGGQGLVADAGDLQIGAIYIDIAMTDEEEMVSAHAKETVSRWGVPMIEPIRGHCRDCVYYISIDGHFDLVDYGVCALCDSPFDGRVVSRNSGCPAFIGTD